MEWISWHGCYDGGWQGLITPDSFAHPAKFSYRLTQRIYQHGLERGYWKPGNTIGDCFGGIGTGGIIAAYAGLAWRGVELEPRFVAMANQNFALHRGKWERLGVPLPVMVQGDSRRFASLIVGCEGVVSSPPYVSGGHHADQTGAWNTNGGGHGMTKDDANYGSTEGQIGRLPAGAVDGIVSSPPYAVNALGHAGGEGPRTTNAAHSKPGTVNSQTYGTTAGNIGNLAEGRLDGVVRKTLIVATSSSTMCGKEVPHEPSISAGRKPEELRSIHGQVGAEGQRDQVAVPEDELVASKDRSVLRRASRRSSKSDGKAGRQVSRKVKEGKAASELQARKGDGALPGDDCQGQVPELWNDGMLVDSPQERRSLRQPAGEPGDSLRALPHQPGEEAMVGGKEGGSADAKEQRAGRMEVSAIVSSPPWSRSMNHDPGDNDCLHESEDGVHRPVGISQRQADYGDTEGQIGRETADTYWSAVAQVYEQCRLALKPGGVMALVVKDYVKDKKRVPLCDQTCQLLERLGFTVFERCRAWLVSRTEHQGLFGKVVKEKARKSFFRRLAEKKGSPRIDFECVIWAKA